uniref:Uncharacterized protein n=1 Tax=Glossina pallidipes TaxID=7398 RepID=A0A1B0A3M2_GLOPL
MESHECTFASYSKTMDMQEDRKTDAHNSVVRYSATELHDVKKPLSQHIHILHLSLVLSLSLIPLAVVDLNDVSQNVMKVFTFLKRGLTHQEEVFELRYKHQKGLSNKDHMTCYRQYMHEYNELILEDDRRSKAMSMLRKFIKK